MTRGRPTDGGHRLGLIVDLFAEEIPLAQNENEEYSPAKHRNLHDIHEPPDETVDIRHRLQGSAIRAL